MSCLIAMANPSPDTAMWMNVDTIQTIWLDYYKDWRIAYVGEERYSGGNSTITTEMFPTRQDAIGRIRQIEALVNSKCGTTTFKIKNMPIKDR